MYEAFFDALARCDWARAYEVVRSHLEARKVGREYFLRLCSCDSYIGWPTEDNDEAEIWLRAGSINIYVSINNEIVVQ